MPDVVGHKLETAISILNQYNFEIIIKESFGKKDVKSDEVRVIRQKRCGEKALQLIIAYF